MSTSACNKKHKLTVFLIKNDYKEVGEFLSFDGFEIVDVEHDGSVVGQLIY